MTQKLFFATGGSEFSRYTDGTPSSWYISTSSSTESVQTEYGQGNWNAVFVYWNAPEGQTNQFNAQSFIQYLHTQSNNPNIPVFLIIPAQYASQATTWQSRSNATGYVLWDANNPTEFLNQVQTILKQYNVSAA